MKNQFVGQLVDDVVAVSVQLIDVEILDTLMVTEFGPGVLFVADLAHDLDFWAIYFNVVI